MRPPATYAETCDVDLPLRPGRRRYPLFQDRYEDNRKIIGVTLGGGKQSQRRPTPCLPCSPVRGGSASQLASSPPIPTHEAHHGGRRNHCFRSEGQDHWPRTRHLVQPRYRVLVHHYQEGSSCSPLRGARPHTLNLHRAGSPKRRRSRGWSGVRVVLVPQERIVVGWHGDE